MANGYYSDGTITLANGGTAITGIATMFVSAGLRPGDKLVVKGFTVPLATVVAESGAGAATLVEVWPGTSLTNAPYRIEYQPDLTRTLESHLDLLMMLKGSGNLEALGDLPLAADRMIYATAPGVLAATPITAYIRSLADDPNANTARATLGVVIGSDVQPANAKLTALAGASWAADKGLLLTGANTLTTFDLTAAGRAVAGAANATAQRTALVAARDPALSGNDFTSNLNALVTPGWHADLLGPGCVNLPVANYFYLQVLAAGGNITQIAYPYATGGSPPHGVYVRGRFGGVWTVWRQQVYAGETLLTLSLQNPTSGSWPVQVTHQDRNILFTMTGTSAFGYYAQYGGTPIGSISQARRERNGGRCSQRTRPAPSGRLRG